MKVIAIDENVNTNANLNHNTRPARYPSESTITENAQHNSTAQGMNDDRKTNRAEWGTKARSSRVSQVKENNRTQ